MEERSYPHFPSDLVKSQFHLDRYIKFIDSRPSRLNKSEKYYLENHHKFPKSLGGIDLKENMILLTAREHFIAHLILWKAFEAGMTYAFFRMVTSNQNGKKSWLTSKQYQTLRENHAKNVSSLNKGKPNTWQIGVPRSQETKDKISDSNKGKKRTENCKKIQSERQKGQKHSEKTKQKMKESRKGKKPSQKTIDAAAKYHKGRPRSEETRGKISKALKARAKIRKEKRNA